jgi:hypothetical protein
MPKCISSDPICWSARLERPALLAFEMINCDHFPLRDRLVIREVCIETFRIACDPSQPLLGGYVLGAGALVIAPQYRIVAPNQEGSDCGVNPQSMGVALAEGEMLVSTREM